MEIIKSNCIVFFLSLVLIIFENKAPLPVRSTCWQYSITNASVKSEDGIIVMEDDVMRIDTNDTINHVVKVEIYKTCGQKVLVLNGCHASVCSFKLNKLISDQYVVSVSTSLGNVITEIVTIS